MNPSKIKISVVLPNLRAGGAERVMSFVAEKLDSSKFETTLVVIGFEDEAAYDVKGIKLVFFNKERVQSGVKELFQYIRTNRPHIVLSAVGHLNTLTAYMSWFFPKIKFVAREVNVLSVLAQFNSQGKGLWLLKVMGKNRFNRFDKIICQSQDMLEDLNKNNTITQGKLKIINNPVTSGFTLKAKNKVSNPIRFITVARLVRQKGHARIIEALGKLDFHFHYTIIGDGPEKDSLFKRITELGFMDNIKHVPFTKEVAKYLADSDLYLQGSFVEGFPNAIIESCMVGTPVLAINAPGGINEIVYDGINGHVVPDGETFVDYLNSINADYKFAPKDVSETITSRYSPEIIIKKYEDLFITLVS